MMFLMRMDSARYLVNRLMMRDPAYEAEFDEMDLSAIKEIGNIIAGSNLKILGRIFGNVDCKGAIILSGNIEGDVSARNLQFMAGGIQGNVSIGEDITTDKGTQVRGDVSAQTAVLSGDMQGELLVRGDLELRSTSTVLGNIKARAISINSGSRIKGMLDVGGDPEEEETAYEE